MLVTFLDGFKNETDIRRKLMRSQNMIIPVMIARTTMIMYTTTKWMIRLWKE